MMTTKNKGKFRVVAYCRVSSSDQVASLVTVKGSLEEQEETARRYADQQDWEFVRSYIEPGISGEKFLERAALQQMLEDAGKGLFDCVIVKAGDRLARDQEIFFRITKILNHQFNIQILNLSNPSQIVDPTAFNGRRNPMLIIQQGLDSMMAAFDQSRRVNMLAEGRKRQVRAGRYIYAIPPFGYRFDTVIIGGKKVERIPVPDPVEYQVIEMLPRLVIEELMSTKQIAEYLETNTAIKPRHAEHWKRPNVLGLLNQPFYGGKLRYGDSTNYVRQDGQVMRHKNQNSEEIILVDHSYEHPWSWETYEKIQQVIQSRRVNEGKTHVSGSPFASILFCGYCGSGMTFKRSTRNLYRKLKLRPRKDGTQRIAYYNVNSISPDYYVCRLHDNNATFCQRNRIKHSKVMDYVVAEIETFVKQAVENPQEFYKQFQKKDLTGKIGSLETKIKAAQKELNETLVAKTERLNRGYLNGTVAEEQYPVLTQMLKEEKDRLVESLARLETELAEINHSNQNVARIRQFVEEYERFKEKLSQPVYEWTPDEPRKVRFWLKQYFSKIYIKVDETDPLKNATFQVELQPL